MRVEILEERLKDTDATTGQHYNLVKGDVITVPDAYGARLCGFGWVRDVDGIVPTGERIPGAEVLAPKRMKIGGM